jgi:multiple sugar transport system substrate-binding protein
VSADRLRVALVGGPMYDHLYEAFGPYDVEIVVHADHPTLNARVAELLGSGERIDVLATHSKYAPSQAPWLRPLDALIDPAAVADLAPRAVELCRFGADLLSLPRLIDVRILWARTDRITHVPDTWAQLVDSGISFGFTGRESGLFGMFYELVAGNGATLFDAELRPTMNTAEAVAAIETLVLLARRAPAELPDWHYDQVDLALLRGEVDAAPAWPGAWDAIRASELASALRPFPYPAGPVRRVSYAGCHSWAIPTTCGDIDGAVALVEYLASAELQSRDAAHGAMCAHRGALAAVKPSNDVDARRLAITRATIDTAMITYPPLASFPAIEAAGWSALRAALIGSCTPQAAAAMIQATAERILH